MTFPTMRQWLRAHKALSSTPDHAMKMARAMDRARKMEAVAGAARIYTAGCHHKDECNCGSAQEHALVTALADLDSV